MEASQSLERAKKFGSNSHDGDSNSAQPRPGINSMVIDPKSAHQQGNPVAEVPSNFKLELAIGDIDIFLGNAKQAAMKKDADTIQRAIDTLCAYPRVDPHIVQFWPDFPILFKVFAAEYNLTSMALAQLHLARADYLTSLGGLELEIVKFHEIAAPTKDERELVALLEELKSQVVTVGNGLASLRANRE
ncbi:hypothetical protein CCACVL1_29817 [Corchorus capsularis]|uniref:Uncharacterized protein n=1 Tax=Corchorus capsularis TaxID=210143 RepID=A0A1R3FZW8_COCAP|nr:hypothetical protein CCACVL1_29817 [Corchorus capsularis]